MRASMHRIPISSSSLASLFYDPERQALEVEFRSGQIYRYLQVSAEIYSELLAAPSHGAYFNVSIRNQFAFHQITSASLARSTPI